MTSDTQLGAGNSDFPSTAWDVLRRFDSLPEPTQELNALADRYWRPVYRFIRYVWKKQIEDAKDLTQEFFLSVFDPDFLRAADPTRGSFRKFILGSLRNFLTDHDRAGRAAKRGGGKTILPLDMTDAPQLLNLPAAEPDGEEAFNRAWAQEILRRAIERLEFEYSTTDRKKQFESFRRYVLENEASNKSYRALGEDLGMTETEVQSGLRSTKRDLRRHCLGLIQETVSDPAQVQIEMKTLFGPT